MKRLRKISRIVIVALVALTFVSPGSASAAAKADPKPVFSYTHIPGNGNEYFVSKNGVLVNMVRIGEIDGRLKHSITTATPNGKISKFSETGPSYRFATIYASGAKGKEVIYVYNSETKKIKALNMSLKKIWEVKLANDDGYVGDINKEDGSIRISKTEKLTIDGKKANFKSVSPKVKRVGKYEYRVNEKEQTIQKTDKETGKVLWKKRAFDIKGKDGNKISAVAVRYASLDEKGNAFAAVDYPGTPTQVVAVSNNGKYLWKKTGYIYEGQTVGDVVYYAEDIPGGLDDFIQEYNLVIANKNTGKVIKTYKNLNSADGSQVKMRGNNLYVIGETFADVYNSKGKRIVSYKSPKGRAILTDQFDNKNNLHIQSGFYTNPPKKENGWVFTYSPTGKLISKKIFDQKNYYRVLIDPSGKQNYMIKQIPGKNHKETIEFYKYN